jgi:hypothetical membrane protein
MRYSNKKIAGLLLFIAGVVGVLGIIVAEALYPGYSTSQNYISDLGVGPSATIFNTSLMVLGLLTLASSYFIQKTFKTALFTIPLAITGIGAIGVGIFTEDFQTIHFIFSLITFLFAGITSIISYKLGKPPLSYLSIILGGFTLLALVLFGSGTYMGLGKGGMERLIAYPALLWSTGFGGHLVGLSD